MATNEKHEVTMSDGRKITFGKVEKMKKTFIIEPVTLAVLGLRFDCVNGDSETIMDADVHETLRGKFMWHGVSQKHGDEYASVDLPADCIETLRQIKARTVKGEWNGERDGFTGAGVLFEACKLAYPEMTPEAIREILNGMTAKEKAAYKASDEMKPFVTKVEADRNKGVDISKLQAKFKPVAATPEVPPVEPTIEVAA